ncbi:MULTISPECIES: hypothetical protein [Streptomyces]|uniref:hypothetical protein n=1 Tax=Streptomyces TaxID=1883 RepID=UPI003639F4E7
METPSVEVAGGEVHAVVDGLDVALDVVVERSSTNSVASAPREVSRRICSSSPTISF